MNVIVLVNDSFRRDHLGCYGNSWIHTPNLDRLAEESTVFDRAYIASYPTIPNRWDMNTGRFGFPFRGWQPLGHEDVTLAQTLGGHGVSTALIHDTPMLEMHDMNYTRGYSAFWWIRGQHQDPYVADPSVPLKLTAQAHKIFGPEAMEAYIRNQADLRYEYQYPVARSATAAMEWLQLNLRQDPFFLWVDMWDPHEPFDPPWYDWNLYREPEYDGERIIYPHYGRPSYMTDEELKAVRALYAGKVTLVDRWVGRLLDTIELLGLKENTMIVWTTDHGHLFGEHDLQGKPGSELGNLYEETSHIPLIVRDPRGIGAGKRVGGLVQPPDLFPTVMEFLDLPVPEFVQGRSMWPLITGERDSIREAVVSSRFPPQMGDFFLGGIPIDKFDPKETPGPTFDGWLSSNRAVDPITLTTERWAYLCAPPGRRSELYDLEGDPQQKQNLVDQQPDVAQKLRRSLLDFLERNGAPAKRLTPFVEGGPTALMHLDTKLWTIEDDRGLLIGFPSEEGARSRVAWDAPGPKRTPVEMPFGRLLDADPKNLVRNYAQYYWAQDLA